MSRNKNIADDSAYVKIIGNLKRDPVLDNPEKLTDSIMQGIQDEVEEITPRFILRYGTAISMAVRFLAAASITLLVVFGIEQYIFVDKVIQQENRNASLSQKSGQLKGLEFILSNTDVKKVMMAAGQEHEPEGFVKGRIEKARMLALNNYN
ncbi:MAG: hypothetical protein KKA81_06885 [Bacteroidetes bacterium]|nr:hypothetical protein [Bacteroidota bacterium]